MSKNRNKNSKGNSNAESHSATETAQDDSSDSMEQIKGKKKYPDITLLCLTKLEAYLDQKEKLTSKMRKMEDESSEEDGKVKKEQRLVKNREAAHQFRLRQKQYIEDLETKMDILTRENTDSRAKLELLQAENKLIKEQLAHVRAFISQAISASLNPLAAFAQMQQQQQQQNNPMFNSQNLLSAVNSILTTNNPQSMETSNSTDPSQANITQLFNQMAASLMNDTPVNPAFLSAMDSTDTTEQSLSDEQSEETSLQDLDEK